MSPPELYPKRWREGFKVFKEIEIYGKCTFKGINKKYEKFSSKHYKEIGVIMGEFEPKGFFKLLATEQKTT